MSTSKLDHVTFRISEVINRKFYILDFPIKKTKKIEEQVKIELKFKLSPEIKKNIVEIRFSISFKHIETNKIVCELETSFIFIIVDLSNYIQGTTFKSDKIPITLLSVSYSTFRGILLEKFRGTIFGDIPPLPLLDPKSLISETTPANI